MLEHLVQSHLGGYYISDLEPEFIEMYCETCGDYDEILTSWNSEEENTKTNDLLKYFMSSTLNTKEDLDKKVDAYDNSYIEKNEIIGCIINEIECNSDDTYNIITALHENKDLSDNEKDKILKISLMEEKRQINMIKKFANSYFTKDKEGNVKVLKRVKK